MPLLLSLPDELLVHVLSMCDADTGVALRWSCSRWLAVTHSDGWKTIGNDGRTLYAYYASLPTYETPPASPEFIRRIRQYELLLRISSERCGKITRQIPRQLLCFGAGHTAADRPQWASSFIRCCHRTQYYIERETARPQSDASAVAQHCFALARHLLSDPAIFNGIGVREKAAMISIFARYNEQALLQLVLQNARDLTLEDYREPVMVATLFRHVEIVEILWEAVRDSDRPEQFVLDQVRIFTTRALWKQPVFDDLRLIMRFLRSPLLRRPLLNALGSFYSEHLFLEELVFFAWPAVTLAQTLLCDQGACAGYQPVMILTLIPLVFFVVVPLFFFMHLKCH